MEIPREVTGRERTSFQLIHDIEGMKLSYRPFSTTLEEYERIVESGVMDGDTNQEYSKYEIALWKQFGAAAEKYRKKKPKPVVINDPFKNCVSVREIPQKKGVIRLGQSFQFPRWDCNEKTKEERNQPNRGETGF